MKHFKKILDATSSSSSTAETFNVKRISTWQAAEGGDLQRFGAPAQTNDNLQSALNTADGYFSWRSTDGTLGKKAGFRYAVDWFAAQNKPIYWAKFLLDSSLSNSTIWLGVHTSLPGATTANTGAHMMLRYVNGTDTNFMLSTCDSGGTQTVSDSGVAPVVDTTFVVKIDASEFPTSITMTIYDKDLTELGSVNKTTNLPSAPTLMRPIFRIANQALGAVNLGLGKVQLEVD